MRSFAILTFGLAVALAPASAFAQSQPPAQQPPAQPAGQPPAAAAAPSAPKLTFSSNAGLLLVQVKPDQTAAFEELISKLKAGLAKSDKPELKQQAGSWHAYKAAEPMQGNTLYVVIIDPAVPNSEYQFYELLHKTLTPEEQRAPETQEMYKKYAAAIASLNKLNITPVGGGQ